MRFYVNIDCGNAAFENDEGPEETARDNELARIIRKQVLEPLEHDVGAVGGTLRDSNGNRVGEWGLTRRKARA